MNVQYMQCGLIFQGLVIHDVGVAQGESIPPWQTDKFVKLGRYELHSGGGDGLVFASGVFFKEEDVAGDAPSSFFMMD
ncbi:hypothetical protein [Kribbella italica]|uniref:Uncharacterized protein n=1 Tax=Kribbella italica TaxID=1540520 RepID=A0A7W9MWN6_9ACTN|nr:hypothetical protein [Kribbella italica]MBB5838485.1 hypothetical protein [Kribbella italica]